MMVPVAELNSDTVDYPDQMKSMASLAEQFLKSHGWCAEILQGYLAWGFPKICLFLYQVRRSSTLFWTWVVVGDLPPAYLDVSFCPNAYEAFEGYIGEMMAWVRAVKTGMPVVDLIPVYDHRTLEKPMPTPALAQELEKRVDFVRLKILVEYRDDLVLNRYRKDE